MASDDTAPHGETLAPGVVLTQLGGNCPVQGEGFVGGIPFYFRSRWDRWSFSVGQDPVGEPSWYLESSYGPAPAAGWMDRELAEILILKCANMFLDLNDAGAWNEDKPDPETAPGRMKKMMDALAQNDAPEIQAIVDAMKGSAKP